MLKKIQKMLRNRKGFTLVELIVVVAILGILATVAVPRVAGFKDDAEEARDAANKRLMRNAAELYLVEKGNPSDEETWESDKNKDDWGKYLNEWPKGVTSVTIDEDGNIDVN